MDRVTNGGFISILGRCVDSTTASSSLSNALSAREVKKLLIQKGFRVEITNIKARNTVTA